INNPLGAILHNVQNIKRRLSPELAKNVELAAEVQSFVAARMEESERSRCLWLVGLPAIRFAGEGDEGSLFRELQVDGLGATWAVPGLEALMEEPALKGELWRAMRRVRQRWSSEIQ
ncbi:hypothetical protein ACLXBB_33100, partial [Pseudomonas aeruginosa]